MKRNIKGSSHERHGGNKMPEYYIWSSMKARCQNKATWNYSRYGGRGIAFCDEWNFFSNFIRDMGKRPSKKHQLDRIDPNGQYCKNNCRWTTPQTNAANRPRYTDKLGAYKRGSKYVSKIGINNTVIHLGTYESKEDAQDIYIKTFKEWHGFYPLNTEV